MAASKTSFEQIPVETVKIIAKEFPEENEIGSDGGNTEMPDEVRSPHESWREVAQKVQHERDPKRMTELVDRRFPVDAANSFRQRGPTLKSNPTLENEIAVDRERVEDALRKNEERYRTLFDLAPVAVYSCDGSGVILEYNNRAAELWGRKPELGDTDERFCGSFKMYRPDGSFMPHEQCPMGDVLTGKVSGIHDGEVHIERPDGSRVIVIVNIAPVKDDRGEVIGAINCFYDVTERKKAEEIRHQAEKVLRLANEELESVVQKRTASLRRLSAKLIRSQDEERRRIARNLHDSLGQYLASIKMYLELLRGSDVPNKDEVLSAALESVERSISETRTLSFLLHPPLLDELGFSSAARWYTDEFAKRSGIKVELELPDEGIERLPELIRTALFRILQESLTNVHRHSASPSVEVRLKVNHQAVLTVRDFGRGVPAELLQGSQTNGEHYGVGLSGMRERVTDLGGTFEIQSSGNGTLITVSIPLAPETSGAGTSALKNLAA